MRGVLAVDHADGVRNSSRAPGARDQRVMMLCGAASLVVVSLLVSSRIASSGYLNDVSGAWAALADDLRHGLLYRPAISDVGYGGTRYFPLHIVLHAAIACTGLSLRSSGHVLELLSATLLVFSAARILARSGAPIHLAVGLAPIALASRTAVMGAAGIRGDLLPVALGLAALAFIPEDDDDSTVPSGLLIAFAILAKPSVVWAPAAVAVALLSRRSFGLLLKVASVAGLMVVASLAATELASEGRMLDSFRAHASGGGFSFRKFAEALRFVRPGELLWIVGGNVACLAHGRGVLRDPISAAMLSATLVTMLLFTSEGTHTNHLIDVSVLGAVSVCAAVVSLHEQAKVLVRWLALCTGLALLEAVLLSGLDLRRGELEAATAAIPAGNQPILSEQPWIPLLAGERVFLLDPFNLLRLRNESAVLHDDLLDRLDRRSFRAVVLNGRAESDLEYYEYGRFGGGFPQHLLANYRLAGVHGGHAVYVPKGSETGSGLLRTPADRVETVRDRGMRPTRVRMVAQEFARLVGIDLF